MNWDLIVLVFLVRLCSRLVRLNHCGNADLTAWSGWTRVVDRAENAADALRGHGVDSVRDTR